MYLPRLGQHATSSKYCGREDGNGFFNDMPLHLLVYLELKKGSNMGLGRTITLLFVVYYVDDLRLV